MPRKTPKNPSDYSSTEDPEVTALRVNKQKADYWKQQERLHQFFSIDNGSQSEQQGEQEGEQEAMEMLRWIEQSKRESPLDSNNQLTSSATIVRRLRLTSSVVQDTFITQEPRQDISPDLLQDDFAQDTLPENADYDLADDDIFMMELEDGPFSQPNTPGKESDGDSPLYPRSLRY